MRLCLTCYHLTPAGGLFCLSCGRSFGCRLCDKKKHANPYNARRCITCASDRLSQPTWFLPVGWLLRGLTLAALIMTLRWLWPRLQPVAERHWGWLLNLPGACLETAVTWSLLIGLVYFLLTLVPGEAGKLLCRAYLGALKAALRLVQRLVQRVTGGLGKLLISLFAGGKRPTST